MLNRQRQADEGDWDVPQGDGRSEGTLRTARE